ncbi:MAG: hypothetical protein ACRD09_08580 [Vicinamibacterales bacterium]
MRKLLVIAAAAVVMIAPTRAAPQDPPRTLLGRAIAAAGGLENLQRHAVLAWHGTATVTVPGRVVRIEGDWRIEPPDRAVVETFDIEKGPGSMRTLVIDGERGWSSRAGQSQPLPQALVANERDQFYLYYLLRLAPLGGNGFRLTPIDPDTEGNAGIRVQCAGRRDADLYFNRDHRLVRLATAVADPASGGDIAEELRFSGEITASGIRWPRRIQIIQNGAPFFDLALTRFRTLERLDLPPSFRPVIKLCETWFE